MRKKSLIAALLLPLPFAALPVLAVLAAHFMSPGHAGKVAINPVPVQQQIHETRTSGHAMAHSVADPFDGCSEDSPPPVEG